MLAVALTVLFLWRNLGVVFVGEPSSSSPSRDGTEMLQEQDTSTTTTRLAKQDANHFLIPPDDLATLRQQQHRLNHMVGVYISLIPDSTGHVMGACVQ
jgi:hypothetical protein